MYIQWINLGLVDQWRGLKELSQSISGQETCTVDPKKMWTSKNWWVEEKWWRYSRIKGSCAKGASRHEWGCWCHMNAHWGGCVVVTSSICNQTRRWFGVRKWGCDVVSDSDHCLTIHIPRIGLVLSHAACFPFGSRWHPRVASSCLHTSSPNGKWRTNPQTCSYWGNQAALGIKKWILHSYFCVSVVE